MGEDIGGQRPSFGVGPAKRDSRFGDRLQGRGQVPVERRVARASHSLRLHAATEEIETQAQVLRVLGVEAVECPRRRPNACLGRARFGDRRVNRRLESRQRLGEQRRIDRLLGVEVEVERRRRVTGLGGDGAQAGALQAPGCKDALGGLENEATL